MLHDIIKYGNEMELELGVTGTYLNTNRQIYKTMNLEVIERRLLGLDDEIHRLLQYIYEQKKHDIESEVKEYEDLKKTISKCLKEPISPTSEIRKMREKQYLA